MTTPTTRLTAQQVRTLPLDTFHGLAASVNDSEPLMRVYAGPEWAELDNDGKLWVQALARETMARLTEGFVITLNDDRPARGLLIGFALSALIWLAVAFAVWAIVS